MSETTKIQWCHHTFNPWRGCTKVSAGCTNCYAEAQSKRNPAVLGEWGPGGKRAMAAESYWSQPFAWAKKARGAGERSRVFCASLADIFEDRPELVEPRARLFRTIATTPELDWLLLTKRPENIVRLWPGTGDLPVTLIERDGHRVLANVWLGTSVEDQRTADARIPLLLQTPAAVRFVSYEPALGPVDFTRLGRRTESTAVVNGLTGYYDHAPYEEGIGASLDWVIVGGESGPGARSFDMEWARSMVRQCESAGVAVFVKQLGSRPFETQGATWIRRTSSFGGVYKHFRDRKGGDPSEWPAELRVRQFPEAKEPK